MHDEGRGDGEKSGQSKKTGPLSGRHSPDIATYEAEHYTDELDRINGERKPGNSTPSPQAARGGRWCQGGGTYLRPKDSNTAVGVRDRATGKALEGAERQTDKQTFRALE